MNLSLVLLLSSLVLMVSSEQADYYWRDFDGSIPKDAFDAARNSDGDIIYIGQGLFTQPNLGLISGTIYEGSLNLTVTAQVKVFTTDDNIKILCTGHPNNFRWIPITGYSDLSLLTNTHLVEGGVEGGVILHIGRVLHEGSTEIGKIYHFGPHGISLNVPNDDKGESSYEKFEILVYFFDTIDTN